jgi:hypothetical protein
MHLIQKNLAVPDLGIGIFDVDAASPEGFDFGSFQNHPGLIFIINKKIVFGLTIFRYDFDMF